MHRTVFATVLAGTVMVVTAACSSTSSGPAPSSAPTVTVGTTTGANPGGNGNSAPASTTPPGPTPTGNPLAACAPGQVEVTAESMGAATSHYGLKLVFSLADPARPCTLTGYPGMDETTESGEVIHAERTPRGFIGGLPAGTDKESTVVVESGRPAQAVAESVACGVYDKPDPKVVKTQVTPPNSTDTRVIDKSLSTCGLKIHPVTG